MLFPNLHTYASHSSVSVEAPGLPAFELPAPLADAYGGALGFVAPCLYANFVASLDGVTGLPALVQSNHLIAAGSEHDRFVMGLLRACADAVLVGSGTMAASPATVWTAEHAYPPAAPLYAELRRRRGRPPQPTLAVLTGSGGIDPRHPGLGPSLFASLVAAGLVDELFLTRSPVLAGRPASERRLALLEAELPPTHAIAARLLALRRAESQLFLRYTLSPT